MCECSILADIKDRRRELKDMITAKIAIMRNVVSSGRSITLLKEPLPLFVSLSYFCSFTVYRIVYRHPLPEIKYKETVVARTQIRSLALIT